MFGLWNNWTTPIYGKDYVYSDNSFYLYYINTLEKENSGKFSITDDKNKALKNSKILYVDEWWKNTPDFLKIKLGKFKVDNEFLTSAPKNIKIMHSNSVC